MKEVNRQIKLLLLALVLGVWGLLAQSFFTSASGSAVPAKRIYVATSNKEGKIFFDNSPGNIGFSASGLLTVLDEAARKGIKIHSVVSPSGIGGYVVVFRKW